MISKEFTYEKGNRPECERKENKMKTEINIHAINFLKLSDK